MAQVSPILRVWADPTGDGQRVAWWCPGCKHLHWVPVAPEKVDHRWKWDGNVTEPSIEPSVRHYFTRYQRDAEGKLIADAAGKPLPGEEVTTCHYYVTKGRIIFCGDCRHELNGKTVPLPILPPPSEYGYPDEPHASEDPR